MERCIVQHMEDEMVFMRINRGLTEEIEEIRLLILPKENFVWC